MEPEHIGFQKGGHPWEHFVRFHLKLQACSVCCTSPADHVWDQHFVTLKRDRISGETPNDVQKHPCHPVVFLVNQICVHANFSRRRRYQGDAPFHSNQFPIISIALENSDQRLKLVATNRKEESSAKATIVIAGWSPLMSLIQIIGWQLNIGMYHWHFMDLLYWTGHDNRPPCQSGNPMHMS